MFYGLATKGDAYYNAVLERFIAMAPCIFQDYYDSYDVLVSTF